MSKLKRPALALALALALATGVAIGPTPSHVLAGGGACNHGGNAASVGCRNNAQGDIYTGAFADWTNSNMSLDWYHYSHGYHINNEMWVYTSSDKQQFIEMGLRNGLAIGGDPCGDGICVAYELFWADWNGDGHEYSHFLANATPDGSAHSYEMISRPASSIWDLYYDGNYRGTSTIELSGTANEVEVGLELASTYNGDIGAWAHADTFDNYNLETRDTGGSWSFFPYINTWRDYPCGNVYSPPFCLNGNAPSTWEWMENKP